MSWRDIATAQKFRIPLLVKRWLRDIINQFKTMFLYPHYKTFSIWEFKISNTLVVYRRAHLVTS